MLGLPLFWGSLGALRIRGCNVLLSCRYLCSRAIYDGSRKVYREQRLLGYSCDQIFDIISGVEQYSEFLPWCLDSVILQTHPTKGKLCRLSIGFYPFKESYNSWVTVIRPKYVKSVATNSYLFEHLINEWHIRPGLSDNENTCTVELKVDFRFRSKLHSRISSLFFDQVVDFMVGAFLGRANTLHGPGSIPRQPPTILEYTK
ncbi:coenzyme Q binding protein COQ10 A [Echinococcus multilocularis]|uniref:Coenzyme Q binding protein COQ10 A n=1 Tax=Echinococcus multilocularis TaxID=6211 RepID=A0A068YDW1_ECHMU|nr:coenzyme Q binding protein COQ10 A [Echinococcus multilocularis]